MGEPDGELGEEQRGRKVSCGQYGSVLMNPDAKAPLHAATINETDAETALREGGSNPLRVPRH